jgi:hypothetical protein
VGVLARQARGARDRDRSGDDLAERRPVDLLSVELVTLKLWELPQEDG